MRFTRQGQSCTAASRIYVHRSLMDKFVARLTERLNEMVIGDPLDEATDIGTIISPAQRATIDRYVAIGEATPGARVIRCGRMALRPPRSEEHTSELQSLMRTSYAVFCLKNKK